MSIVKYLIRAGVPAELHESALASIEESRQRQKRIRKYELLAPFVVPFALCDVEWGSNRLPDNWLMYNTEPLEHIDINGDKKEWVEINGVGVPMPVPLEDMPAVRALCYWARDWRKFFLQPAHPRSTWARWVWLGWRNRAQYAAWVNGKPYSGPPAEWHLHNDQLKLDVYQMDDVWQVKYEKRFLYFFALRRNVGYSINNITPDLRTYNGSAVMMSIKSAIGLRIWQR